MKFTVRMRFIIGILIVIVFSVGLFLYLEHSMARIHSVEATINSDSYTVGIDYSSIIEKQYIEESAYVKAGDPLFELRSSSLADALRNDQVSQGSLLYTVTENGTILVTASAEGRVQSISERVGAFVPANTELAKINLKDGLYISATYKLSSPDYARLSTGSKIVVTLPDNTKVDARIYDITLETRDKEVYTTVKARVDQAKINQVVFTTGTPVESVLYLNNDTLLTRIFRYVTQMFQPSGR